MATAILEFDPTSESAANSPLLVWDTTSYAVTAFDPDAADQSVQWASSVDTEGSLPASAKDENRTISMTIECLSAAALRTLQAKVTKISRERGTLKYTLPNSEVVIFDLLARASFKAEFDVMYFITSGAYCTVNVSFSAKPYGRGPSITLSSHTETTLPALVFTETGIKGDVAALGDLRVTGTTAAQQMWVWGLESRYYSSAATAALYYEAEALTLAGPTSRVVGPSGASGSGSNVVHHASLGTSPGDMLSTLITSGTASMTHIGKFRVFARFQAPVTNTGTVSVRFRWGRPLTSTGWTTNETVAIDPTYEGSWRLVDLGQILLPPIPSSLLIGGAAPQWAGMLQAYSTVSGDQVDVDFVMFVPFDEGSGQATDTADTFVDGDLKVRHDGAFSSTGASYLPIQKYEGDYLKIPPAGAEGRTVRMIVKPSRGPVLTGADAGVDDMQATLTYTPRYLVVPSP